MDKDAYYFPHFSNSRFDRKIKRIRKELQLEGYGIYFMLLEVLREQSDFRYPMQDIDLLADEFETSEQKVRTVICNYGLFKIDDDEHFFSPKQIMFLQPYLAKSERARAAANARWAQVSYKCNANALPEQSKCNASKVKKSKVKESKVKEYLHISQKLKSKILEVSSNAKITETNLINWADTFRKMIEIDKRTEVQISHLIDGVFMDQFWSTNIRSADKLRLRLNEGKLDRCLTISEPETEQRKPVYKTEFDFS